MATRDLDRLAKYVRARRAECYTSRKAAAAAAGISKDTWQRVEEAQRVHEGKYAQVDRALGWANGSCIAIAEGAEPVRATYVESGGGDVTMAVRPPAAWAGSSAEDVVRRAGADGVLATVPG
ncbi:helix-turn-helix domain-containing protein, partial [Streptomyces sp. NPDC057757]|uniref:helix-turn-helix domain-containing protein n=1 Tax=Streptomyces sp. NPDC057757 TaxID=3346241 RepID=UPI003694F35B